MKEGWTKEKNDAIVVISAPSAGSWQFLENAQLGVLGGHEHLPFPYVTWKNFFFFTSTNSAHCKHTQNNAFYMQVLKNSLFCSKYFHSFSNATWILWYFWRNSVNVRWHDIGEGWFSFKPKHLLYWGCKKMHIFKWCHLWMTPL